MVAQLGLHEINMVLNTPKFFVLLLTKKKQTKTNKRWHSQFKIVDNISFKEQGVWVSESVKTFISKFLLC